MLQRRLIVATAMGVALLAGCATGGAGRSADRESTDQLLATLSSEQRAPITQAENAVREAEREASRADEAVQLAEQRVQAAEADVDAQAAAIEKARAQAELVRKQTEAQLEGAPVSGQVPAEAQAARRRLEEAEHAIEVAQWQRERAEALARLRESEQAYAEAFRDAAQEQVAAREAEADLVRERVASRARPAAVPGVVDPRVADAQAGMREAQANFARARAEATQRLADVQLQRRSMARFEGGPPARLSGSQPGQGQSGAQGLVSQPREVEAEPLPWPSAWQQDQGGQPKGDGQRPPAQQ